MRKRPMKFNVGDVFRTPHGSDYTVAQRPQVSTHDELVVEVVATVSTGRQITLFLTRWRRYKIIR